MLKKIMTVIVMMTYFLQINFALASTLAPYNTTASQSTNVPYATVDTEGTYLPPGAMSTDNPIVALQSLGLGTPHWNWGPVSFGGEYDSLLGTIFNAQYVQKLTPESAIGFLGEYGPNQYRLNGTLGYQPWESGMAKFSVDYLSQVLPFDFDSGNIDQRVYQTAYGLQLQQNFAHPLFKDINMGGYWSHASNIGLSDVQFLDDDGYWYTNERNIAGATAQGLDIGTDLALTPYTGLGAKFFYHDVHYNTKFRSVSTDNNVGAGGSLQIDQVITNRMKVSGKAEIRAIYNTYGGTLSWVPEFGKMIGLRLSLFGGRLVSHNQTPDSNNIGLEVAFLSDESSKSPAYAMQNAPMLSDLVDWVRTPAVYMDRVLAVAEQNTYLNAPMASNISPNTGPYIGGNTITINGTNFLPGVSVTFDNMPASTALVSSTVLSVIVPAFTPATQTLKASNAETTNVDVVIKNANGQETVLSGGYTYTTANAPTLSNISPDSGSIEGNTTVTLTGTQLTGTSSVQFDSIDATNVTVINDTTVTAVTPAHAAGSVNVSLSTAGGVAELVGGYTYFAAPSVNSINPSHGPITGGTLVTIIGSNFSSATAVNFGDQLATSFDVISDTEITAVSPAASATTVDITVTNPAGTSTTSSADQFTYIGAPTITSISPNSGSINGGTSVTIIGTGFTSVTEASGVTFGGTDATSYTVNSDTQITASTPAHSAGAVDVVVTNAIGSETASNAYTYSSLPTISSLSPSTGIAYGGTGVTITGTNFTADSTVKFGDTEAVILAVYSDTSMLVISPPLPAGTVNVTVTTPNGSATATDAFTYYAPPEVTSVSPNTGSTSGGTSVTLSGSGFTGATAVTFGGSEATSFSVNSDNSITAVSPPGSEGIVHVTVTTLGGTSTTSVADQFIYGTLQPPTISSLSPSTGVAYGGTGVTITGTNFTADSTVKFGDTEAVIFAVYSDTSMLVVSPLLPAGTVDVTVTTPAGSATATDAFTYYAPPEVTSVSPHTGPTSGGTSVTLSGSGFTGATAVAFGGSEATSFSVNSDNSITAVSPPGSEGIVQVTVTTPGGTSATSVANQFIYGTLQPPTISSLSPTTGVAYGGTAVTITGTNFTADSAVTFGDTEAVILAVYSDTSMLVVSPPLPAGTVSVTVTTAGGSATATDAFTYTETP